MIQGHRRLRSRVQLSTIAIVKSLAVGLFAALLFRQSCPPWYLGLLLSTTILQSMGLIAIKSPRGSVRTPFSPLRLGHANSALQIAWATILFCLPSLPELVYGAIYAALGALQVVVFVKYLYRFRLLLIRTLAPQMPPLPHLPETVR